VGGLPSGTVTFLFTDLEGSTRLWEEHPDAMKAALARHDEILREEIERRGGDVVKSTGDGVYAVFARAADAAEAAVAAQRALDAEAWDETGPLRVRMGLHTGESERRDGDYFGPEPNRAARLMAAAHGGQIVVSSATARRLRAELSGAIELADLGEHRLRGLSQAEHVYQLGAPGIRRQFPPLATVDRFPGRLTLPFPPFACGAETFAGRLAELATLEEARARSVDGTRQVVLLAGDPGIGKTRLAAQLARRAYADGTIVLYGRCDEQSIVPYQPLVEALRPVVASTPASLLHEQLRGLDIELARVFPELLGRIPHDPLHDLSAEPEAQRYCLFEAFAALLNGIATAQPAIVVVDDLQWADNPTLLLLRHLLRSPPTTALLVILCYRDVDLGRGAPVSDLLADLGREAGATRIVLGGLSATDSAELLASCAGRELKHDASALLHRETDGNPLFLGELLRHLVETGVLSRFEGEQLDADGLGALDLPQGVRNVITRRLRRLPELVNDVLRVAAVIGPEFDAETLARSAGVDAPTVLDSLDVARDAGLARAVPGRRDTFAFCHSLVRQTIERELGTGERARLHATVGLALESSAIPPSSATLAHHFEQATPVLGFDPAIRYAARAGREAFDDLAFEEAARYFETTLELQHRRGPVAAVERIDVLTQLAAALVYVDERSGVDVAFRAVDAARADGSAEQFARAVVVLVEPTYAVTAFPEQTARLVDEALAALGAAEPALRARLVAFEAFKHAAYQLHGRDRRALAEQAVDLARGVDDPATLAESLWALAVNLEGTTELARRRAIGEELLDLGHVTGSRSSAFGLRVLAGVHLELGDAEALDATIAELARIGDARRWLPAQVYAVQWRATQALLEGRFDDVRASGDDLRRYARAYRGAAGMHAVQHFFLAREQGEIGNTSMLEHAAAEHPDNLYAQAILALARLESGEPDRAAARTLALFERHVHSPGERESAWPAVLAILAEVTATLGSTAHAAVIAEHLEPFAGQVVTAMLGLGCLGAADRYLGMLRGALGDSDAAERHFERALALEERVRGRALVPRTRYWQARSLLERARPGDGERAAAIAAEAAAEADALGMRRLSDLATRLAPT